MENEEDYDVLVCARISGFGRPIYGSLRAVCGRCNQPIWVSLSGQKALRENKNLKPFCVECTNIKMMESAEEIKASIVPGAVEELKRYFGKVEDN